MATLGDVLKEQGYVLPQRLTGHIGGESVPGSDLRSVAHLLPRFWRALFELQEDGAEVLPRRCPVRARHFSQVFGQDFLLLSGNVFSELSLPDPRQCRSAGTRGVLMRWFAVVASGVAAGAARSG